jgi:hypothetical protein
LDRLKKNKKIIVPFLHGIASTSLTGQIQGVLVQMKDIKRSRKYIRYMNVKITERNDGFLSNQCNQSEYYGLHGVM